MGDVAEFQQAQVGQHAEEMLDEGQQAEDDEARRHGPQAVAGGVAQQRQVERLVVDDAQANCKQHGHGAGEQADVDQFAAAADASQVEHGGGRHAHQQHELRQPVPDGQHDDHRHHAGQQQGQFLPIDDGHNHAEQQHGDQFARARRRPARPAGQPHGGDGHQQQDDQPRQAGQRPALAVSHVDAAQQQARRRSSP